MFKEIAVNNYKSIVDLKLSLGRVNVLIGENGAGKSNILEAIALAGAANAGKLDNEFLVARGVRVTPPQLMRPAFRGAKLNDPITIKVTDEASTVEYVIKNDNKPYARWNVMVKDSLRAIQDDHIKSKVDEFIHSNEVEKETIIEDMKELVKVITETLNSGDKSIKRNVRLKRPNVVANFIFGAFGSSRSESHSSIANFVIFSPENTSLRVFEREGQIEPLGVNGEGLLRLLSVLSQKDPVAVEEIKSALKLIGWFKDFRVVQDSDQLQDRLEVRDIFLGRGRFYDDQRSVNEGFLFLMFYFALFSTDLTPTFFAVDNIDASLNPKLCEALMKQLVAMSARHQKQVLLTTHNPAVLDGLNLDDEDQKLFIVDRSESGETRVRNYKKPLRSSGSPTRLSEAFLRGSLGGVPKGF
ncbi:MAG: AAA family ATPase [Methylocystis sp.]|uniref:AAA family ATPase n=1 Tax=Methylocystis sp. TaxID=1911079 RepID=UPI00393F580D